MNEKACVVCGVVKPLTDFYARGQGRRADCKQCNNARTPKPLGPPSPAPSVPPPALSASTIVADRTSRLRESELRRKFDVLAAENERLNKLLETMRAVAPASPNVIITPKHEKGDAVPIWMAGDWHVEELVEGHKIQNLNHFDLDEAEARGRKFFVSGLRLTDIAARDSRIKKILLDLGGDFFSNGIHEELLETNQLGPTQAVAFVRDLMVSGIKYVLANSDLSIDIACVVGNHGRITKKIRFSTAVENNLEYLLYQWIASEFANEPRVTFHICPGTMQFVTLFDDYLVRVVHGYEIKSGGGIGGITIPIRKKLAAWDQAMQADLTLIHHFHQKLDGGNFLVNGSLIGYNEYCQANGFSPEPAQQTFALIDRRNGGEKTLVAPIRVL